MVRSSYGGAVLVGGSSTRMGSDKASLDFGGRPLVDVPLAALRHASTVSLVGGDPGRRATAGVVSIADIDPGSGPLGGLISALQEATEEITVVLSCDLPFIDVAAVEILVESIGTADACVPLVNGHKQWLAAAWNRSALPTLSRRYRDGERSVKRCADGLGVAWTLYGRPALFADVDTPAELQAALAVTSSAGRATLCP